MSGGTLTASGASTFTNNSGGFVMTGGQANFNGGINYGTDDANNGNYFEVSGGTLTTPWINTGRSSMNYSTLALAEADASTNAITVNGTGVLNITGSVNLGAVTPNNSNSSSAMLITSGNLTVGGPLYINLNNTRYSVLDVNGGTFVSNDTANGVVLGGPANSYAGEALFQVRAGTATVQKITFGEGAGGTGVVNLVTSGTLYLGSGGIVLGTSNSTYAYSILLGNATLWCSATG